MKLIDWIPGASFVSHVANNIGKGWREEGLIGACKVVAKGFAKDTALSFALLALSFPASVATASCAALAKVGTSTLLKLGSKAALSAGGVAKFGATAGTVGLAAGGLDLFNFLDLKSEKAEKAAAEARSSGAQPA